VSAETSTVVVSPCAITMSGRCLVIMRSIGASIAPVRVASVFDLDPTVI
jgi:hypothetical protein